MTKILKHAPELRQKILAAKGKLSASEAGERHGLTRNAVIGIWHRAGLPPLTSVERYVIESRSKKVMWQQRKAAAQ